MLAAFLTSCNNAGRIVDTIDREIMSIAKDRCRELVMVLKLCLIYKVMATLVLCNAHMSIGVIDRATQNSVLCDTRTCVVRIIGRATQNSKLYDKCACVYVIGRTTLSTLLYHY